MAAPILGMWGSSVEKEGASYQDSAPSTLFDWKELNMRTLFTALLIAVSALSVPAAAAICPTCGVDHGATQSGGKVSTAQHIAQQRANYMAARGFKGHPPRSAGNWAQVGSFEGVGWAGGRRSKNSIPTCTPGRGRQLVADAVAYGRGGSYRVRIWR